MSVIITLNILQGMSDNPNWNCLVEAASQQKGYFTTDQARSCGFSWDLLSHRASSGSIRRIRRGLYRLPDYPSSPREEVMVGWLSSGRESAVVSHESALELHGLTDLIPSSTHVIVPRSRRGYRAPAGVTVHTTQDLPEVDIVTREGMRITSPARSIADAAETGVSPEHVQVAVREALDRGLTTRKRLFRIADSRGGRVKAIIERAVEGGSGAV